MFLGEFEDAQDPALVASGVETGTGYANEFGDAVVA
jgi:hypothetical protein